MSNKPNKPQAMSILNDPNAVVLIVFTITIVSIAFTLAYNEL